MATWTNITTATFTTGSIALTGYGGSYYYAKCDVNGHGMITLQGTSTSSYGHLANDSTTKARVASDLGVTPVTWYDNATNPYQGTLYWSGSAWQSLSIRNQTNIYGLRY